MFIAKHPESWIPQQQHLHQGFLCAHQGFPAKPGAWCACVSLGSREMLEIWFSDPFLNEAETRIKPQSVAFLVIILNKDCNIVTSQECWSSFHSDVKCLRCFNGIGFLSSCLRKVIHGFVDQL